MLLLQTCTVYTGITCNLDHRGLICQLILKVMLKTIVKNLFWSLKTMKIDRTNLCMLFFSKR